MAAALVLAVLVALPIIVVLSSLLQPGSDSWSHLVDTVLLGYTANTVVLALGVAFGTVCLGVGAAWLVTLCSFPGRRIFEWALFLPLAIPAYLLAYT
ncbi:MAG: hypothetical protein R3360_01760 [Alphaproteobacteria bacterium]|nr:hypothetical protein [Alphaproteobacteria bacterium]